MRAALANVPDGVVMEQFDIRDLPFYDGDVEEAGVPASVTALHEALSASDGLVIFTPEYNASYPAVTKNVIDWLSRPPKAWSGTPITLVACTPGPRAGAGVRDHFSAIMAHQPVEAFETFGIGSYGDKLDDAGELVDESTIAELAAFIASFAAAAV